MGMGSKLIIMMMSINIILFLIGSTSGLPMFVNTTHLPLISGNQSSDSLVYVQFNNATGNMSVEDKSEILAKFHLDSNTTTGAFFGSDFLAGMYNTYSLVSGAINFLINMFFAPVVTLQMFSTPMPIVFMVGVIWVVMYIISIVTLIRGVDW